MEHRGVKYEIKIAIGRSQWTWIAHTPPKPREGSIEGAKRDAILAAEKAIDRWWAKRLRTMKVQTEYALLMASRLVRGRMVHKRAMSEADIPRLAAAPRAASQSGRH